VSDTKKKPAAPAGKNPKVAKAMLKVSRKLKILARLEKVLKSL
jgi:hypothetical protein